MDSGDIRSVNIDWQVVFLLVNVVVLGLMLVIIMLMLCIGRLLYYKMKQDVPPQKPTREIWVQDAEVRRTVHIHVESQDPQVLAGHSLGRLLSTTESSPQSQSGDGLRANGPE